MENCGTIEESWEEKAAHTYKMDQFITPNIETELNIPCNKCQGGWKKR